MNKLTYSARFLLEAIWGEGIFVFVMVVMVMVLLFGSALDGQGEFPLASVGVSPAILK